MNYGGGSLYCDYLGRSGFAPAFTFTPEESLMSISYNSEKFTFTVLTDNTFILKRIGNSVTKGIYNAGYTFTVAYNQIVYVNAWIPSDSDIYIS